MVTKFKNIPESTEYGKPKEFVSWIEIFCTELTKIKGTNEYCEDNLLTIKQIIGANKDSIPAGLDVLGLIDLNLQVKDLNEFKTDVMSRLLNVENDLSTLRTQVLKNTDSINTINYNLTGINHELDLLSEGYENCSNDIRLIQNSISSLESKYNNLQKSVSSLSSSLSALQTTVSNLSTKINTLTSDLNKLATRVTNLEKKDLSPKALGCVQAGPNAVKLMASTSAPSSPTTDGHPVGTIWIVI